MIGKFDIKINKPCKFLAFLFGGAIGSAIFPPFAGAGAGYLSLVIFFAYLFSVSKVDKSVFGWAYLYSFSFFVAGFSWICNALLIDGDKFISFVPVVILAIGLFFGLFIAIAVFFMKFFENRYAKALMLCVGILFLEWVRSFIFTGFPWNLFGTALAFDVRLIYGASVVGVYGLSLMVLLFISGLGLIVERLRFGKFDKKALWFVFVPFLFLGIFFFRFEKFEEGDIKVRLVQPNIEQTFKWDRELFYKNFRQYVDLSKSKPLDGVKLVVWGETASPYMLDRDEVHLREITEAIGNDGFLATGVMRIGFENGEYVPYNSLFVIDKTGNIKDYYDKVHLVPFGEYLPFREYLPDFMKPVANVVGNLGRGEKYKNIKVKGLPLMGGAICYESIFPSEVINPKAKPEVLLVVANDGWYGISKGPYQHLVAAQFRAIEEGITVIRSANTGISAVIMPNGEVFGEIGLGKEGVSDVLLPKVLSVPTIYGKYGNLMLLLMIVILSGLAFGINRAQKARLS